MLRYPAIFGLRPAWATPIIGKYPEILESRRAGPSRHTASAFLFRQFSVPSRTVDRSCCMITLTLAPHQPGDKGGTVTRLVGVPNNLREHQRRPVARGRCHWATLRNDTFWSTHWAPKPDSFAESIHDGLVDETSLSGWATGISRTSAT